LHTECTGGNNVNGDCPRHEDFERRIRDADQSLIRVYDLMNELTQQHAEVYAQFSRSVAVLDSLEKRVDRHEKEAQDKLNKIECKIGNIESKLEGKVDNVCKKLDVIRAEHNKLSGKVGVWGAIILLFAANVLQLMWGL